MHALPAVRRLATVAMSAVAVCLLTATMPARAAAPHAARPPADEEVRGMWVLRTSLTTPESIRKMVATADRAGINTLMVQVRGRGDAYYAASVDPRAADIQDAPAGFDPLALTLALAHDAGIRVHAWFNVDLVSSATALPQAPSHIVLRHPEWLMVPKALAPALRDTPAELPAYVGELARWTRGHAESVEGLYLSPITDGSQDYTTSVVRDLVGRYALDGIHFDYSAASLAAFRASVLPRVPAADRARLDTRAATSPTVWADTFPDGWAAFRRNRLTALATRLRSAARTARPGITVSAAVIGDADEARNSRLQDWGAWAQAGLLDVICPMLYTADADQFRASLDRVKATADGVPVWAGIGAYRLPPARTLDHMRIARQGGAAGLLLFSYDSLSAADAPAHYFDLLRPALLDSSNGSGAIRR